MDRQDLMNLASRVAHAPSYEARIAELIRSAPEATLNRYGLSHTGSGIGSFLAFTGVFALGAGIGAGVALLFAPTTGEQMRNKLRSSANDLGNEVKDAAAKAEEKMVSTRERVASSVAPKSAYATAENGVVEPAQSPTRTARF